MAFPKLTQQPIERVDATPDDGYPLRILRAYRQLCDCLWSVEGDVDSTMYDIMNEHNRQRAIVLDKAIDQLAKAEG